MAKKGGYTISDIYQGGYSSLESDYGDLALGVNVPTHEIGAPLKADTANQLQQMNQMLNQGIVPIEVGALSPDVFDQIPKQHFKEMKRLAKLTGAKVSLHAPIIEPSGLSQDGWSEQSRLEAERRLAEAVDRASEMVPEGGMPVTIHSAGIPGKEWTMTKDGEKMEKLIAINQETKKMAPLTGETKYYPMMQERLPDGRVVSLPVNPKGETMVPEEELESLNHTEWDNSISSAVFQKENADRIIEQNYKVIQNILPQIYADKIKRNDLKPIELEAYERLETAQDFLKHTRLLANGLFDKAYKYAKDDEAKKVLMKISEEYAKEAATRDPLEQSQALQKLLGKLRIQELQPNLYIPIEDFALEHSTKTFANVAWDSYKTHKEKSPIINIENLYPGVAFARGKEMDQLITTTRNKFVEKAMSEGLSKSKAEAEAERIIGMTFDVGHLNIHKKKGFKDEDLMKEAKEFMKHVKHVHLTDNFGYSDSHLAPGMGNVPTKEYLKMLEKQGYKGTKIVEAPGFAQHFGTSPYTAILEALGAPILAQQNYPSWNQAPGLFQGYYSGLGTYLPQLHFETFGGGFSQLPMELGGQRGGASGNRFSGRPME